MESANLPIVRRVLILATVGWLVAGCAAPDARRPVLRISNWGGAGDDGPFEQMIRRKDQEFEAATGAIVRKEGIPGEYVPKMLLNFVAGTQPDVMVVDASSAAVFINNGMLQDLTPFMAKDSKFRLTDYYENVLDTYRNRSGGDHLAKVENGIYAIPNDFTPMVMYYNKDLFDAAGVPYPKDDWTFADFLETSKRLTKKGQFGFAFSNWMPGWVMFLWNNGGDVLAPDGRKASGYFDSKANVETLTFIRDLITKHRVAPSLSETAAMGVDPFANGQAAMTVSGHWAMVGYKSAKAINWERLGVVCLPHNVPVSQTVLYMSAYGIPKGAKNPELAWKYIEMWTSQALQREYQTTGIAVCARKDVSEERAGLASNAPTPEQRIERQFLPIVPTGRPPYGSRIEGYEIVEKVGTSAMQSVLNGADVQSTLTEAAKRIDREFAKSK